MGESSEKEECDRKKVCTEIGAGDLSVDGDKGRSSVSVNEGSKVSNVEDDDDDDDLLEELNEPLARVIEKASALEKDAVYTLVDIYYIMVDGRVSPVGGFQLNNDKVRYIWMPNSLCSNYDAKKVMNLKKKIDNGKKGYAVYRGMKQNKHGSFSYDMDWVKKNGN